MTQEMKDLLLRDLCGRLTYGVKLQDDLGDILPLDYPRRCETIKSFTQILSDAIEEYKLRPYLRSMSTMTKEEREEYDLFFSYGEHGWDEYTISDEIPNIIDWLNSHHFDYRGLIKRGLAIEAPIKMYNKN